MHGLVVEYVLGKSGELSRVPPAEQILPARSILVSYCQGSLTYPQALEAYAKVRPTTHALDLLHDILTANDQPLPDAPASARPGQAKTRSWTNAEDLRLVAGILQFGADDWSRVTAFVGSGRSKSQCHQRWTRGLDPRIIKATWTSQQDETLLMLVALYGRKCWTSVAFGMGNRCDVQCRYRFNILRKDVNFDARMRAAGQKIRANPAILGRPLMPWRPRKRTQEVRQVVQTGIDSDSEMFADSQDPIDALFPDIEPSRTFENSGTDFDDSE